MELQQQLEELVNGRLSGSDCFLVDVQIAGAKTNPKVIVLLDGDRGVSIDTCAEISRWLGKQIEDKDIIPSAYTLEVSSPGISQPLRLFRQYPQHIGRKLKVVLNDGSTKIGKLQEIKAESIIMEEEGKGKKKGTAQPPVEIPVHQIAKAFVLVSFE